MEIKGVQSDNKLYFSQLLKCLLMLFPFWVAHPVYSQKHIQDRIIDSLRNAVAHAGHDTRNAVLLEYLSFIVSDDSATNAPLIRAGIQEAIRKNDHPTVLRGYEIMRHWYNGMGLYSQSREYGLKTAKYAIEHQYNQTAAYSYAFIAKSFMNTADFDSAMRYTDKSKEIFTQLSDYTGLAVVADTYGLIRVMQGNYKEGNIFYNKALEYLSQSDSAYYKGIVNYHLGFSYMHTSDYELASYYIHKALDIWEGLPRFGLPPKWNASEMLGNIYLKLKKYDLSLKYHRQALTYRRQHWDGLLADSLNLSYAYSFNNIAETYYHLGRLDSAYYYANQSLKIKLRPMTYASKQDIANSYLNFSNILLKMDSVQKAEKNIMEAVRLFSEAKWKEGLIESLLTQASIYQKYGKTNESILILNQAKELADETGSRLQEMTIWRQLADIYDDMGEMSASNRALRNFAELKDSIFNSDMDHRIAEMMVKYEADKKELENGFLREQNIDQQKTQMYLRWALMLFAAFVVLLVAFVVLLRINLSRKSDQLSKQAEINQLLKQKYDQDLEFRNKELQMLIESIKSKNDMLETVKDVMLDEIRTNCKAPVETIHRAVRTILSHLTNDQDWSLLERQINELSTDFRTKLTQLHPSLTALDFKLLTFIRLKIPTREMARLLGINEDSVRKQKFRLKKKLNVEADTLEDYVNSL